ncbi:MAG TPA: ABC transporter permease [Gemmataceae bacterium]|jgi:putative ABC transport system permease protein|nr:ABC transporter permease [Gemmataceae bacterium]
MRFLESVLYVAAIFFVVAYLVVLGIMLFHDKGRRTLILALRSLWLHKMRAMLSVLGIIIGTSAVISLMAFGEGSMQDALEDIKRMGATNIIIRSVKPPDEISTQTRSFVASYGITQEDYDLIQSIPPIIRVVPMRIFPKPVYHYQYMWNSRIVATTPEYKDINKLQEASGRFLVDSDSVDMENVCVLGSSVAEKLFPFGDAIGQTILIDKFNYLVVGVEEERMPTGGSGGSMAAENYNSDVYIPIGTAKGRFGKTVFLRQSGTRSGEQVEYSQLTLTVSDTDQVRPVGEAVKQILDRHAKKDTELTLPLDRLEEAERAKDRYKMLLALIASISLVVGGIGIMNIMLATVTERTREIGIRRALGAKRRDITMQFLIEAVVQTTIGGLVGVILGLLIILIVPWVASVPAKLHTLSIFLSLAVAVCVGVLFGWYPARRASLLDPIEALRHE